MTGPVQPIPDAWKNQVASILESNDKTRIEWTLRAARDWQVFGLPYEAHERLKRYLHDPVLLGREVHGMPGTTEVWEFLVPHPLKSPRPLYAKIDLKNGCVSIKLFSLHIDLTGDLEKAIQAFLKKRKKGKK